MKTATTTAMLLTVILLANAVIANDGWLTDFEKAKAAAQEKSRPILADFTGSDWCKWCIMLDQEVFSQEQFKAYAADNFILFMADFPRHKSIPSATKKQNEALAKKYTVQGFPTVILMDADGNVIARTGYQQGGASAYIEHLKKLLETKK